MRIISKFHDYYDGAMAQGMDLSLIYHRNTEYIRPTDDRNWWREFEKKFSNLIGGKAHSYSHPSNLPYSGNIDVNSGILAFCGKAYLIVLDGGVSEGNVPRVLTDKDITDKLEKAKKAPQFYSYGYDKKEQEVKSWEAIQIAAIKGRKAIDEKSIDSSVFHELNCPCFLFVPHGLSWCGSNQMIIKNPCLKDLKFFQILDPFACYQELAMYVGGVLAQADIAPLRVGGDKIIAQSKGFDEMSFRTLAPGHKKLNRRENRLKKRGIVNG